MVGQMRGPQGSGTNKPPSSTSSELMPSENSQVSDHNIRLTQQYVSSTSNLCYNNQRIQPKMIKSESPHAQYVKKVPQITNNQILSIIPGTKNDKLNDMQPNFVAMQQKINEKLLANQNVPQQIVMTSKPNYVNYLPLQKITVNDKPKNNIVVMETQKNVQGQTYYTVQPNKSEFKPLNTYLAMTPKTDNPTFLMSKNETYLVTPKPGETVPQTAYLMTPKSEAYLLPTIQQNKTDIIMLPTTQNSVFLDYEKNDNLVNNNVPLLPNGKSNVYLSPDSSENRDEKVPNTVPHSHQYLIPNMDKFKMNSVGVPKVKEELHNYTKSEKRYNNNNVLKYKNVNSKKYIEEDVKAKNEDSDEGCEVRPVFDPRYPIVYQIVMTDHSYVQTTPPMFRDRSVTETKATISNIIKKEDDNDSIVSSDCKTDDEGEETETAAEGEESITRCICDLDHDDGYMVCCDKCSVWQHVACVFPEVKGVAPLPEEYLCDACQPRKLDKTRARLMQLQKMNKHKLVRHSESSDSSSSSADTTKQTAQGAKKTVARRRAEPVQRKPSKSDSSGNITSTSKAATSKMRRRDSVAVKNDTAAKTSSSTVTSTSNLSSSVGRRTKCKRNMENKVQQRRKSKSKDEKEVSSSGNSSNLSNTTSTTPSTKSSTSSASGLREWIEHYEEAVANHYTTELRNRLKDVKHTGGGDLSIRSGSGVRCRLSQLTNGDKILVATCNLTYGQPIIEVKGKFMLLGQNLPKSEWMFYYKLPKDGSEVVIDVSNYGNCSRYVRRSCKPNSQLKHCMEKNNLRLYLVTCSNLEKNQEITIAHNAWLNSSSTCACRSKDCALLVKNNHTSQSERRRRGRRRTVSEDSDGSPLKNSRPEPRSTTREVLVETRRNSTVTQQQAPSPSPVSPTYIESCKDKDRKLTRDERKIEQAMKIFAQMERDTARKKDKDHRPVETSVGVGGGATTRSRKTSQSMSRQDSDKESPESARPKRRKRRKGRSTTSQHDTNNSNRRLRFNSADSDLTSADEITSPRDKRSSRDSRDSTTSPVKENPGRSLRKRSIASRRDSTSSSRSRDRDDAANLLLTLSGVRTPPRQVDLLKESEGEGSPPTPLSSACLLVAAAVGPLAPGFKFPKTKKGLMNEWLSKSPEPVTPEYPSQVVSESQKEVTLPPGAPKLSNLSSRLFSLGDEKEKVVEQLESKMGGGGFAKKRWLRQAISEECEAPTVYVGQGSPPCPPDNITPLKKRRLARESLSSDPPSTPPPAACHNFQSTVERNGEVNSPESPSMVDPETEISLAERVDALRREYLEAQVAGNTNEVTDEKPLDLTNEKEKQENNFLQPKVQDNKKDTKVVRKGRVKRFAVKKLNNQCADDAVRSSPRLRKNDQKVEIQPKADIKCEVEDDELKEQVDSTTTVECEDVKVEAVTVIKEEVKENEEQISSVTVDSTPTPTDIVRIETEIKVEESEEQPTEVKEMQTEIEQPPVEEKEEEQQVSSPKDVITFEEEPKEHAEPEIKVEEEDPPQLISVTETEKSDKIEEEDHLSNDRSNDAATDEKLSEEEKCLEEKSAPIKRKLSITEYLKRKKGSSSAQNKGMDLHTISESLSPRTTPPPALSPPSDEEKSAVDIPTPTLPPIFLEAEKTLDKPGAVVRFKSEPTELERQRENLTERLRREFGLLITDDEPKAEVPTPPLPPQTPPPQPPPPPPMSHRFEYYPQQQPLPQSAIYPVGSSNPPNPNLLPYPDIPPPVDRKLKFKK